MTYKEIQDLINLVSKSNLSEIKLKDGEFELIIRTKDFAANKNTGMMQMQAAPVQIPQTSPESSAAQVKEAQAKRDTETAKEESAKPAASQNNYIEFKSPMVGTFYRSSGPDKPPFVQVGDSISKGQPVCIIEAMKLFNEIESEYNGKIVKVMVDDATPIEYDQVLFLIDPKG